MGTTVRFAGTPAPRIRAVADCLALLRQQFGRPQCEIEIARRTTIPANHSTAIQLDVVVCTTGPNHLLDRLPLGPGYFVQQRTAAMPPVLGFECHAALRERLGNYDYYCYLEDDLLIRDPWFFVKLKWFTDEFGDDALLVPNRYELARDRIVHKAYVDGPLQASITEPFQNVSDVPTLEGKVLGRKVMFRRPLNPHAGCFFLNADQMAKWAAQPHFLERNTRFIGPLEGAASLGIMRTFCIYKPVPENAAFLEVEHPGAGFLTLIRMPAAGETVPPPSA